MHKRRMVAVVDDEDSVRIALERVLRASGMQVVTFRGGSEFLAALPGLVLQCVVLDLHMPLLSGFEVLEVLIHTERAPPVVVVTGHDSPEARDRAITAGALAYLTKPIDESLLLDEIAAAATAVRGKH